MGSDRRANSAVNTICMNMTGVHFTPEQAGIIRKHLDKATWPPTVDVKSFEDFPTLSETLECKHSRVCCLHCGLMEYTLGPGAISKAIQDGVDAATKKSDPRKTDYKRVDVTVELIGTSQPLVFPQAFNTYQKGDMFCVYYDGGVQKFPLQHIFRVKETY